MLAHKTKLLEISSAPLVSEKGQEKSPQTKLGAQIPPHEAIEKKKRDGFIDIWL